MKKLKIIFYIFLLLNVGLLAILYKLSFSEDKIILVGTKPLSFFMYASLVMLLFVCLALVILCFVQNRNPGTFFFMFFVSLAIVIVFAGSYFVYKYMTKDETYYIFKSPDDKYSFVAYEWSFVFGGGVVFYERMDPFFVEEKARITTDDGFQPIYNDAYSIEWSDNKVTFTITRGDGRQDGVAFTMKAQESSPSGRR